MWVFRDTASSYAEKETTASAITRYFVKCCVLAENNDVILAAACTVSALILNF